MSDRTKSNPLIRETALGVFTRQADAEALIHVGELLYTLALESCHTWPARGESTIQADLRAAGLDASALATFLREEIGAHHWASSLHEEDANLARIALDVAEDIESIVATISEAVGPA